MPEQVKSSTATPMAFRSDSFAPTSYDDVASATDAKIGTYRGGHRLLRRSGRRAQGTQTLLRLGGDGHRVRRLQPGGVLPTAPGSTSTGGGSATGRRCRRPPKLVDRVAAGSTAVVVYCPGGSAPVPEKRAPAASAFSVTTEDAETVRDDGHRACREDPPRAFRPARCMSHPDVEHHRQTRLSVFRGDTVNFRRLGVV